MKRVWITTAIALVSAAFAIDALAVDDEAQVVYREIFPQGSKSFDDVGWKLYVNADAREASGGSAIADTRDADGDDAPVNSNAPADADRHRGHAYVKEGDAGAPYVLVSNEMPPATQPLVSIK